MGLNPASRPAVPGPALVRRRQRPSRADAARAAQAPRLAALLADPKVLKLFHFGRFDIAVLEHALGVRCEPVYCTKIAARLTRTFTDRFGLKDLCKELLGVDLSKQQQTSDWGADSLSDEQLAYAASDVLHLHALKAKLDALWSAKAAPSWPRPPSASCPAAPAWTWPAGRTSTFSSTARHPKLPTSYLTDSSVQSCPTRWHGFCSNPRRGGLTDLQGWGYMRIGPSLILASRQTLAMTPQLQQAIKLLQFSHLELAAFIQQELEKNPLLSEGAATTARSPSRRRRSSTRRPTPPRRWPPPPRPWPRPTNAGRASMPIAAATARPAESASARTFPTRWISWPSGRARSRPMCSSRSS